MCNDAYGTPRFMAPETLRPMNKEYSTASDIWQCGCVLYYMLCADAPFNTPAEIKRGVYNTSHVTAPLSPEAIDLLAGLLAVKPADRLSMEAILSHSWLGGAAPDIAFSKDYNLRVKTLNIRRKLQVLFEPRARSRSRSGSWSSDSGRPHSDSAELGAGAGAGAGAVQTPARTSSGEGAPPPKLGSPLAESPPSDRGGVEGYKGSYFAGASGLFGGFIDNVSRVCGWTGIDIDAEARYYFTLFDTDSDGWVSRDDLQKGVGLLISESNHRHLQCTPPAEGTGTTTTTTTPPATTPPATTNTNSNSSGTSCISSSSINSNSSSNSSSAYNSHAAHRTRLGPNVVTNINEMFDVMDMDRSHRIDFNKFRAFYSQVLMPSTTKGRSWRTKRGPSGV
jgi:serine/threonine protein kinase